MKIENVEEQIKNIDPNNISENDLAGIEFTIQDTHEFMEENSCHN